VNGIERNMRVFLLFLQSQGGSPIKLLHQNIMYYEIYKVEFREVFSGPTASVLDSLKALPLSLHKRTSWLT
jgi:hypothetical protein